LIKAASFSFFRFFIQTLKYQTASDFRYSSIYSVYGQ